MAEHQRAWKPQRERTASERSVLGFSDHKAALAHPGMCELDRLFRQLPYQHGFAPLLHRAITDFQILKQPGNFEVAAMRTIQLRLAAFNINNKRTGRLAMQHAERHGILQAEQAGSRKDRKSIASALEKVLTWDCLRHRRWNGAMVSNDAKSCYDRIVLWVASLALQRLGTNPTACQEMVQTLQLAVHRVSTAYGDSAGSYGRNRLTPLQGVGQGNGAGPAIWVAISAVLISIMKQEGRGLNWTSAFSQELLSLTSFAFVDDTDLVQFSDSEGTSTQQTAESTQKAVDCWEGILRATGGALRADKSFWYLVSWRFQGGKWHYKATKESPGQVRVRGLNGLYENLKRLEPHEAKKTLGIFVAPDGNWRRQMTKAHTFASQVESGVIRRQDTWYAFTVSFPKTMEYPLLPVKLSKPDWDEILKPVLKVVLPKAGFPVSFPRTLVFAPMGKQGLGIKHPFFKGFISQLRWVLSGGGQSPQGRNLLRTACEELRREVGSYESLGLMNWQSLSSRTTKSWLLTVLVQAHWYNIVLHDPYARPMLQRLGDKFLMKIFTSQGRDDTSLRQLNECRMFLQASTLSDITSADGKMIPRQAWQCDYSWNFRNDDSFPRPIPRKSLNWNLWQAALGDVVLSPRNRLIKDPLGLWLSPQ